MDQRKTGLDLKTSLLAIADLFAPRVCLVCGRRLILAERHVCLCCLADLPRTYFETVTRNPMADRYNEMVSTSEYEPYAYAAALYYYRSEAGYKKISQALKYHRNFAAGRCFASMLADCLAGAPHFSDVDLIVPVPLHWTRYWKRGYNQAEVLARGLSAKMSADVETRMLFRRRRTRTQTRQTRESRAANTSGAFGVSPAFIRALASGRRSAPRHILLVDDVFTTGATISACHRALRAHFGPSVRISAVTLGFAESLL